MPPRTRTPQTVDPEHDAVVDPPPVDPGAAPPGPAGPAKTGAQRTARRSASTASRLGLGVDVGGTGVKVAPVDLNAGTLAEQRLRILTPQPATPDAVAGVVAEGVQHFGWTGPLGVALPAVVLHGRTMTAANIDESWIGTDAAHLFSGRVPGAVAPVNDADAAGLAEVRFGAARDVKGVVLMLTLGTGIGSGLFLDGVLVPNTELGHLKVRGKDAEDRASELVREHKGLSWHSWAKRLSEVLKDLERLLWPDLIVLGGGVSKEPEKFLPLLECRTTVVGAKLANDAGIVGAAVWADENLPRTTGAETTQG